MRLNGVCHHCGEFGQIYARALCTRCYRAIDANDELERWPTSTGIHRRTVGASPTWTHTGPLPTFDRRPACTASTFPEYFDAEADPKDHSQAQTFCFDCPVRAACEAYARRNRMVGLWGGRLFYNYGPQRQEAKRLDDRLHSHLRAAAS